MQTTAGALQDGHGRRLRLRLRTRDPVHVSGLHACSEALAGCSVRWPVNLDGRHGAVEIVRGLPRGAALLELLHDTPA